MQNKILKFLGIVFLIFFIYFFTYTFIIPHNKIIIGLPFSHENLPYDILPMGETLNHPKPQNPQGHPGIDFIWNKKVPIISSSDGVITKIQKHFDGRTWDVEIKSGSYALRYTELGGYNNKLTTGKTISKGDFIGYPQQPFENSKDRNTNFFMIHWEFDYYSSFSDRLCPLTYFDSDSLKLINEIWENSLYKEKNQFPYICSGDYFGKDK